MAAVKTSGFRGAWFSAVTVLMMDGGDTPPSLERLVTLAARRVGPTSRNDGYVTARNNGGDPNDYEAGWRIIVEELVTLLREHGFVDSSLRWVGPTSGKVRWGGDTYPIRPADERQARRDHSMVMLGSNADYGEVQVLGARGGITRKRLEVHPLAHLLPMIPASEIAELRKDIEANGVLVPLLMFEGKVLDGRHRLYLAATLEKPIRLEIFEGTEEEARARVGSLNLLRRHLTTAQRAQLGIDLYQEEATKEAADNYRETVGRPSAKSTRKPGSISRGKTAAQIVSDMTGGTVARSAVEAMQVVQDAPETLAKVRAGEIKQVTAAEKAAREELGTKAPPKVDPWRSTVNAELGRMLGHLRTILGELDLEPGADPTMIAGRLDELEAGVREVRGALAERGLL